MTDIPRGPGGDGSPQLEDGEIDARLRALGLHDAADTRASFIEAGQRLSASLAGRDSPQLDLDAIEARSEYYAGFLAQDDVRALLALVRRLQQENEELRFVLQNSDSLEEVALRGRVEELTEALRALMAVIDGPVEWGSWRGIATGTDTPAFMQARRLLARVVPEKETP